MFCLSNQSNLILDIDFILTYKFMKPQVINQIISKPQMLQYQQSKRYRALIPKNPQQCFYQTIINLLHIRTYAEKLDQQHLQLLFKKSRAYSSLRLKYQYTKLAFQKNIDLSARKQYNIYHAVISWANDIQKELSKEKFSFKQSLIQYFCFRNFQNFEDCIVFLDYVVWPHLISIIKTQHNDSIASDKQKASKSEKQNEEQQQQTQSSEKKMTKLVQSSDKQEQKRGFCIKIGPKVSVLDLLNFVAAILPKTIYNVVIPKQNFPENYFYKISEYQGNQSIGILYRNQNLESLIKQAKSYGRFVKQSLVVLLNSQLEQKMSKSFLLSTFNYYYLFNEEKSQQQRSFASELVIRAIKKCKIAVRYALTDQIYLFVRILIKLAKQQFLKELCQQFGEWFRQQILEKSKQLNLVGHPIQQLRPYPGQLFSFSSSVNINPGQSLKRIIQIYHHYSLFYFRIKPAKDDITIRLLELCEFQSDQHFKQPKIHFVREKVHSQLSQPIQFFRPGIYAIQFDNSYSWLKDKLVQYQFTILVPMEIVQDKELYQKTEPWLKIVMGNQQPSKVPQKNIIKKVVLNQDKRNLAEKLSNISERKGPKDFRQLLLFKVNFRAKQNTYGLFFMEMLKGNSTTKTYEYESKDPQIFKRKLKSIRFNHCRDINIFGKSVSSMIELIEQFENHKTIQLKINSQTNISERNLQKRNEEAQVEEPSNSDLKQSQ